MNTYCPSSVVVNSSQFLLFVWHYWTQFDDDWQKSRTQRPLPSSYIPGISENQDCCQESLFCWDLFDFSSATATHNSTKLDRKQEIKFLYHVCISWDNRKVRMVSLISYWLKPCRDQSLLNLSCLRTFEFQTSLGIPLLHFTSPLKLLKGISWNFTGCNNTVPFSKFVLVDWSEIQDSCPGLWLAKTF